MLSNQPNERETDKFSLRTNNKISIDRDNNNKSRVNYKYIDNNKDNIREDERKRSTRELLSFKAQMCEQANRFDDMVKLMDELCLQYDDLTTDERNLLSCAYKNVIGSRRTSWRIFKESMNAAEAAAQLKSTTTVPTHNNDKIAPNGLIISPPSTATSNHLSPPRISIELQNDRGSPASNNATVTKTTYSIPVIRAFMAQIESELRHHCCNIINILQNRLIPSISATGESRVFYYKMKGDYMRYLCEISGPKERKERANESLMAYKTACDKAIIELPPTHPVRLGLMLNFSVFYYEIMKSPERSCRMAKQAFDDAIAELDTLSEESYRDSTIIMQLLRDNLNLWESEQQQAQHTHHQQQQQQQTSPASSNCVSQNEARPKMTTTNNNSASVTPTLNEETPAN